jgi:hypothetical protein
MVISNPNFVFHVRNICNMSLFANKSGCATKPQHYDMSDAHSARAHLALLDAPAAASTPRAVLPMSTDSAIMLSIQVCALCESKNTAQYSSSKEAVKKQ